jgi:hypothetical protein
VHQEVRRSGQGGVEDEEEVVRVGLGVPRVFRTRL